SIYAHGRRRRRDRDAREVLGRGLVVAGGAGLLALLVDRCRQTLGELAARRIVGRRERQHLAVGLLGLVALAGLERGVGHERPRDAALRRRGRRLQREHLLRDARGAVVVVQLEQRVGGVGQHRGRARVGGERGRETQLAVDAGALHRHQRVAGDALLFGGMRQQRGVAGVGAVRMRRVLVSRLLVLDGRGGVLAAV